MSGIIMTRSPSLREQRANRAALAMRNAIEQGQVEVVCELLDQPGGVTLNTRIDTELSYRGRLPNSDEVDVVAPGCTDYAKGVIAYAASVGIAGVPVLCAIHQRLTRVGWSEKKIIQMFSRDEGIIIPALAAQGAHAFPGSALEFLMKMGVDVRVLNGRKETLLHVAAWKNAHGSIRPLIEAGVPIDSAGDRGFTPMGLALIQGNMDFAVALAEAGADPFFTATTSEKEALCDGLTPAAGKAFQQAWKSRVLINSIAKKHTSTGSPMEPTR